MKYTFQVKIYPHTLSVVQSIESRVKVQVKSLICRLKSSKNVLYWHFLKVIQVLHSTVVIEYKPKSWSIVTNLMHQSLWFWKPIGILTALWGPTSSIPPTIPWSIHKIFKAATGRMGILTNTSPFPFWTSVSNRARHEGPGTRKKIKMEGQVKIRLRLPYMASMISSSNFIDIIGQMKCNISFSTVKF